MCRTFNFITLPAPSKINTNLTTIQDTQFIKKSRQNDFETIEEIANNAMTDDI